MPEIFVYEEKLDGTLKEVTLPRHKIKRPSFKQHEETFNQQQPVAGNTSTASQYQTEVTLPVKLKDRRNSTEDGKLFEKIISLFKESSDIIRSDCRYLDNLISSIVCTVANILRDQAVVQIDMICVVGRLCESEIVQTELRKAIDWSVTVEFVQDPEFAAVKGAIILGYQRAAESTYAIRFKEVVEMERLDTSSLTVARNCDQEPIIELIKKGQIIYEHKCRHNYRTTATCTDVVIEVLKLRSSKKSQLLKSVSKHNPNKILDRSTNIEIEVHFKEGVMRFAVAWSTEDTDMKNREEFNVESSPRQDIGRSRLHPGECRMNASANQGQIDWESFLLAFDKKETFSGDKIVLPQTLPDQSQLDKLLDIHFRQDSDVSLKVIKLVDDLICGTVKRDYPKVKEVWVAYKYDKRKKTEKRTAVVMTEVESKSTDKKFNVSDLETCVYQTDEFSEEAKKVTIYCAKHQSNDSLIDARRVVNMFARDLMRNHRFLSIMKPSAFRSKGFGSDRHNFTPETCIVLYVRKKGYIPVTEKHFQNAYGNLNVDVVEGAFRQCMQEGGTHTLQMGLKIARSLPSPQYGTLGGFLEHPEFGTCGITCAHVLLDDTEMSKLQEKRVLTWLQSDFRVFLCVGEGGFPIGRFVKALYVEGDDVSNGFEVAIFQINDDMQTVGAFMNNDGNELKFEKGKVLSPSRLSTSATVLKFGAKTGKTEGKFTTIMPQISIKLQSKVKADDIILCNQLEVEGNGTSSFSGEGDSGSLVMVKGANGETLCVGILEGITTGNTAIVSPVGPILDKVNVSSFKSFVQDQLLLSVQNLQASVQKLEAGMNEVLNYVRS